MAYTIFKTLSTLTTFMGDWLLCPEAIALFVSALILFNVLRIVRGLLVCFCQWKYKNTTVLPASNAGSQTGLEPPHINSLADGSEISEKTVFRTYSHEQKSCDMAAFSIQGRRKTMEDRFNFLSHNFEHNHSFYAVFDGHGGEVIILGQYFNKRI